MLSRKHALQLKKQKNLWQQGCQKHVVHSGKFMNKFAVIKLIITVEEKMPEFRLIKEMRISSEGIEDMLV